MMGATCVELCHLKDCLHHLLFITLFLLSITTGLAGCLGSRSLVKERKSSGEISIAKVVISKDFINRTNFSLLTHWLPQATPADDGSENRAMGSSCSSNDIVMNQGRTSPLPSGIPTYTVEILNACVGCSGIANIHVSCGWFSSAELVNPSVFRRLSFNDCLVNDGDPLGAGESLSFQYANTLSYPLSVSSVDCF